jgi:prephenate dehydrogenase/chorismate mutase
MKLNENSASEARTAQDSLAKSRDEIKILTKSILDLANSRQKVAVQVARDKVLLREPVFNPDVERKLLLESCEYAKSIGLDEDLARAIVLDLIRFSKIAQSADIYQKQIAKFLETRRIRTISIIGAGRMGVWFAKYFQNLPVNLFFYDENPEKSEEKARALGAGNHESLSQVSESDLVIISVPISRTPKLVRELSRLAEASERDLSIIEISSIKNEMGLSGLLSESASNERIRLYSIHPLFGASAKTFENNPVIQSFPKDTTFMKGLFPHFAIITLDWTVHDGLMGLYLTLPHALALAFADSIHVDGNSWQEVTAITTPSFSHLLELSRKVLNEDPEVYFEIQASNPNTKRTLSDAVNSLLRLEKSINNRSEFVKFFLETRNKIESIDKLQTR